MTTCEEAKQMRSGINVQGKIERKGEVRTVNTKFGETKVCDAYLADDSGSIKLTLWAEDTDKVKDGDMVSCFSFSLCLLRCFSFSLCLLRCFSFIR